MAKFGGFGKCAGTCRANDGNLDYRRAAAALACAVMDLFPQVEAFRIASMASAAVISGVVCTLRNAPPPANAKAIAAAETLSGISVMRMASFSPKAIYISLILPPSISIGPRTASVRSCGLAINRAMASGVYPTW